MAVTSKDIRKKCSENYKQSYKYKRPYPCLSLQSLLGNSPPSKLCSWTYAKWPSHLPHKSWLLSCVPVLQPKLSTGWFHLKQGQQLWIHCLWLNCLLPASTPSFLVAWTSAWGTAAGAGPVLPQLHSLPFPCSASTPKAGWSFQVAILRLLVPGSFLYTSPIGGRAGMWKGEGGRRQVVPPTSFCLGWWERTPSHGSSTHAWGLLSLPPPQMTALRGFSQNHPLFLSLQSRHGLASVCCWSLSSITVPCLASHQSHDPCHKSPMLTSLS